MKKRILSLVLALVMCVGLAAPAFANQRPHLYAYSYDVKGQEEYAGDRLSFFVQAYGHNFDTSAFTLGKGIFIDDPNDLEKVLFPIWNEGNIVATFLITTSEDGAYYGSYSEAYAEQLNALKSTATYSRPLALVVSDRHFYAVVDNRWYDLSDSAGKYTIRSFMPQAELIVVDTTISVPHTIYPQA